MFLGILDNFLRKFSDFFANPVEAHPDAWDIVELARSCRNNFLPIPSKVSFYMKKNGDLAGAKIYKSLKSYWLLNWVSITRVACRCLQLLQQILKRPVFTLARLTRPSCAGALPQESCHWFWNLWFPSGIALGSDCQMTGRGSNLDSNLNSAAWPTGCTGFICSIVSKWTVWSLNSLKTPKLRTTASWYCPDCPKPLTWQFECYSWKLVKLIGSFFQHENSADKF